MCFESRKSWFRHGYHRGIAGGLAGALYGYDAIPEEWRNVLIKREYIEELCEKYLKEFEKQSNVHDYGHLTVDIMKKIC